MGTTRLPAGLPGGTWKKGTRDQSLSHTTATRSPAEVNVKMDSAWGPATTLNMYVSVHENFAKVHTESQGDFVLSLSLSLRILL